MRLAALALTARLMPALQELAAAFQNKAMEFDLVIKSGRTHLQDAVPIRLGQEFKAYGLTLSKAGQQIQQTGSSLEELGIGGSAVGTGLNTHPDYRGKVIQYLQELTGNSRLRPAEDMREAMQSNLCIAQLSSSLKLLALELTRIANDLRLLSSGPTTGLGEINLPPVQPGSSIMPGKVNPVMAEVLNMVAFQVIGNDQTISLSVAAGQLELNVMMPVMIYNLLQSLEILANVLVVFKEKCVQGITANAQRCREYAQASLGLPTALNPYLGYQAVAELVKESLKTKISIVELVLQKGLLGQEQLNRILDPAGMTEKGLLPVGLQNC
jgi:aspartate ammonia-lyase